MNGISSTQTNANQLKENYIRRIRASSTYPTFRSLIGIFVILLYLLGGLIIFAGLIGGLAAMARQGLGGIFVVFGGIIGGLIYIVIGKVVKEASLMLADIADSLLDMNSRYDQQQ